MARGHGCSQREVRPSAATFGAAAAAREALHLPPRLEDDEKRVSSGLDQAMRAAGTGVQAVLAAGKRSLWKKGETRP